MKKVTINKNEAGQRLDKLLRKYLNQAPASFIYKMLRKKNIKLNGKKANGNEILQPFDLIEIYLSDETFEKFSSVRIADPQSTADSSGSSDPYQAVAPLKKNWIIYEDDDICLINKPQGILSQKAVQKDISINEMFISYLLRTSQITSDVLQTFHPSICNRLDRNTTGILIAGKSLPGLQQISKVLQSRDVQKFYWCVVKGILSEERTVNGYLAKDEKTNTVTISTEKLPDSKPICTAYRPIGYGKNTTLLEVHLITGRTHQIRAHLSSIGHPILGDLKYGDVNSNDAVWKSHHIKDQLLHARKLVFPSKAVMEEKAGTLLHLADRSFEAPLPDLFAAYVREEITCLPGNHVD